MPAGPSASPHGGAPSVSAPARIESESKEGQKSDKLTVAVRVRPLHSAERDRDWTDCAQVLQDKVVVLAEPIPTKEKPQKKGGSRGKPVSRPSRPTQRQRQYVFDVAFGGDVTQEMVYVRTTQPLVREVLGGRMATVFAYGATGAGKTFTMLGTASEPGVMVRALQDIFQASSNIENEDLQVGMSYMEIYNENIRDLLNPSAGYLDIREDGKGRNVHVSGLTELSTTSPEQVMELLHRGNKERTVEPTAANKTSSRSHALLQVTVKRDGENGSFCGRLYLIDLAGSERASVTQNHGKRLQEGAHINRSLLALGNCINALASSSSQNMSYINFRDSKLTRLLKEALLGPCLTVMIAHVSPASAHLAETKTTLAYADRAKNISGKVRRRAMEVSHQASQSQYKDLIGELREEISRLKVKIEEGPEEVPGNGHMALNESMSSIDQEELHRMREDLISHFRDQMRLRRRLMEMDSYLLGLATERERQELILNAWEAEKRRRTSVSRRFNNGTSTANKEETEDEPEEVTQAWEEIAFIEEEQERLGTRREEVERRLSSCKSRATSLEEELPRKMSSTEQREVLALLCRVHELEVDKMEAQRQTLLREHELRRRDLLLLRYDRQRQLCEEIITKQRQLLQAAVPPELEDLYQLYQEEAQFQRSALVSRGSSSDVFRAPSVSSSRGSAYGQRLPAISRGNQSSAKPSFNRMTISSSPGSVQFPPLSGLPRSSNTGTKLRPPELDDLQEEEDALGLPPATAATNGMRLSDRRAVSEEALNRPRLKTTFQNYNSGHNLDSLKLSDIRGNTGASRLSKFNASSASDIEDYGNCDYSRKRKKKTALPSNGQRREESKAQKPRHQQDVGVFTSSRLKQSRNN